jgi:hypothetical protein
LYHPLKAGKEHQMVREIGYEQPMSWDEFRIAYHWNKQNFSYMWKRT